MGVAEGKGRSKRADVVLEVPAGAAACGVVAPSTPSAASWARTGHGSRARAPEVALREDRSTPHSTAVLWEPRNHAETGGRSRCVGPNDPPGAPESGSDGVGEPPGPWADPPEAVDPPPEAVPVGSGGSAVNSPGALRTGPRQRRRHVTRLTPGSRHERGVHGQWAQGARSRARRRSGPRRRVRRRSRARPGLRARRRARQRAQG